MAPDMTSDEADSGRSIEDKQQADVLATSGPEDNPQVYLVEYPDGSQNYEPATLTNQLLFESGLYDAVVGTHEYSVRAGSQTLDVATTADIEHKTYTISVGPETVRVPDELVSDYIDIFDGQTGAVRGSRLYKLYKQIIDGQVRRHIIDQFMDRFPDDRIEQTADGVVVDDTFLVNYEAENYLVDNDQVYIRSGGDMVEVDERKQAVELDFATDDSTQIETPSGETVDLSEQEQRFLATIECLLFPDDYLGAELVDGVEQAKAMSFTDDVEQIAETANVSGFTDSKTGNHHGHSFDKHRAISETVAGNLDNTLGMTAQAVDKLYFNDYDHAAPHELIARRNEFENAPFDVFEDDGVANDDSTRWTAIERAKGKAPINETHQEQIEQMFGNESDTIALTTF